MKRTITTLTASALLMTPAHAEPVSTFFIGVAYGLSGAAAAGGVYLGALGAGVAAGAFLATPIGGLLLAAGLQLLGTAATNLFSPSGGGGQQQQTPMDAAKVNVRIDAAPRWIHAGRTRAGGAAIFGEFDSVGAFWYLMALGDSELLSTTSAMFDDQVLTLDGSNYATNSDFTFEDGTRVFQVWSATFSPADPVPTGLPDAFYSAFPSWTVNHKMAGTSLALVRVAPLLPEDRYKVMRWRGAFGLGEPGVSIVGHYSRVYDPRNGAHDISDPATWGQTRNAALIWAWFRTHPYGLDNAMTDINWDLVSDAADRCDVPITDRYGDIAPRYECAISVPDTKARAIAESEILATCDGVLMFDSEGRAYPDVGVWREPAVGLSAARDIMAMSSREAQDGESETDGVVVYYTDPAFGYVRQPSAAWVNPDYYETGTSPTYLNVDILACHNHNQAVRLAKAIGKRSQALQRLAPVVGLRGLLCRRERIVSLDYDETFSGTYEIVSPVELNDDGNTSALNLVPIDANRWTLLAGEEGEKPAAVVDAAGVNPLAYPDNLSIYAAPIIGSSGSAVRLEATFDPSPRADNRFEFQYRKAGDSAWRSFFVSMRELIAATDVVEDGGNYEIRYRTVSTSGQAADYIYPSNVVAVADPSAPGTASGVSATGGVAYADIQWISPNSPNYVAVRISRNTINNFAGSTIVRTEYGPPNTSDTWRDSALGAGTYYYWVRAINGSGVAASPIATGSVVVT